MTADINNLRKEIELLKQSHQLLSLSLDNLKQKIRNGRQLPGGYFFPHLKEASLMYDPIELKDSTNLENAKLFTSRNELTKFCKSRLTKGIGSIKNAVEVGVMTGQYSSFIADEMKPNKLYLFDLNYDVFIDSNYRECQIRITGNSNNQIRNLSNESIDYAYIDGGHDFETVNKDIQEILPKMQKNGIIQFNDYTSFSPCEFIPYGIRSAVNNLINTNNVRVLGISLHKLGFDDIAIQLNK